MGLAERVAARVAAQDLPTALRAWRSRLPLTEALREAQGLPRGWVWQDRFVPYFQEFAKTLEPKLAEDPPRKARVSYAINNFQFFLDPRTGEDGIAYNVARLKEWATAFDLWVR